MQVISFTGEGTVLAGVAGKTITVTRLSLAAHTPVQVTVVGAKLAPLAVPVKVHDFASVCPFTLPTGASLVLRSDKADVKVGGYTELEQA